MASGVVDCCLIPEVSFKLDKLLQYLKEVSLYCLLGKISLSPITLAVRSPLHVAVPKRRQAPCLYIHKEPELCGLILRVKPHK